MTVMRHPRHEILSAYAEGAVDVPRRLLVETHLAMCSECSACLAEDRDVVDSLPDATLRDELELPPFRRVWAAIEEATARQKTLEGTVLPSSLLAALPDQSEWQWHEIVPQRVRSALLVCDPETGSCLFLTHFRPASSFPRHRHLGLEENVLLAGGYDSNGLRAETGDWIAGAPGSEDMPRTDRDEECWCLSRVEAPGIEFLDAES